MAKGDHLTVSRGAYSHHAIDLGNGHVVHFSGEPGHKAHGVIEVATIETFCQGQPVRVVDRRPAFSKDAIVQRALSRVGERGYSVLFNNCEHFVNWCRTAWSKSRQVDRIVERAASVATKLAARSVAKGVSRIAARSATKLAAKALTRAASPCLLVADLAQIGTEIAAIENGADQEDAERTARRVGLCTSVGIGTLVAGPLGFVVGAGLWYAGESVGKCLTSRDVRTVRTTGT